jgi:hypothetical protein
MEILLAVILIAGISVMFWYVYKNSNVPVNHKKQEARDAQLWAHVINDVKLAKAGIKTQSNLTKLIQSQEDDYNKFSYDANFVKAYKKAIDEIKAQIL